MRCPCLKPAHSRLHLESPNLPSPPSRTNARPIQSMTRKQLNRCRASPTLPSPACEAGRVGAQSGGSRKDCLPPCPTFPRFGEGGGGGRGQFDLRITSI